MESTMDIYRGACLDKFASVGINKGILNRISKAYVTFNCNMELEYNCLKYEASRMDYEVMRKIDILIKTLKDIKPGDDNTVLNVKVGLPIFKMVIIDYLRNEKSINTVLDINKLKLNNVDYGTINLKELNRIGILVS